jgi:hypothetical protein
MRHVSGGAEPTKPVPTSQPNDRLGGDRPAGLVVSEPSSKAEADIEAILVA